MKYTTNNVGAKPSVTAGYGIHAGKVIALSDMDIPETPIKEIDREMGELIKNSHALYEETHILLQKIESVSIPESLVAEEKLKEIGTATSLGQGIRDVRMRLEGIRERINDAISRVAL